MSITAASFKEQFPAIAEHCGPKGLEDLVAALQTKDVQAGQTVTGDGEDCDSLFLVFEGELDSQISSGDGTIHLGSLNRGDTFGEVNILDPGPSTSTVIASKDSKLLVLTHDAFTRLDQAHPIMTGNILRMLSSILVDRCRLADELLFSKHTDADDLSADNTKRANAIEWGRHILQKLHGHKGVQQ